ncbi:MAG: NUDIX domain-containing protein, partial [Gemmatimonadetes bacterium]|nr:NUDIX domain-containing protein [Gemmatimonadota bacterium]NIT90404.1 NUDIX domain-containing protein [Gemmatimonadota bacterium]NIU34238.1 NUDIX domain-containing protein [Gemmatimonadota bacterium]NIV64555.1 NUDIX domain-containing protein [Gemmatimonadota bacterium]NIW67309.1 NUDIX domain-containing protein [Gemmatimonadota bacterium]
MSIIRVIAVCVFRKGNRILVGQAYDDVKDEGFFRPLGGSIQAGETAAEAVRREIREELRLEISEPVQLGVLENIFTFRGEPGHEYVVVFDAELADRTLYDQDV